MGKNSNGKGQVLRDDTGWEALAKYVKEKSPSKIFIITDENTNKLCLSIFLEKKKFEFSSESITIPVGEIYKNIGTCFNVWETLSEILVYL